MPVVTVRASSRLSTHSKASQSWHRNLRMHQPPKKKTTSQAFTLKSSLSGPQYFNITYNAWIIPGI